jgi:hypothetical protein
MAVAAFNMNMSLNQKNKMSALVLANVEALADIENDQDNQKREKIFLP